MEDKVSSKECLTPDNRSTSQMSISESSYAQSTGSSSPPTTISSARSRGKQAEYKLKNFLPDNESPVPVLWTIESGSKWSPRYVAVESRIRQILWEAGFSHPHFGIFAAGDNLYDPSRATEVLAFMLDSKDIGNWRKVDKRVKGACLVPWQEVGLPPIRYWLKAVPPGIQEPPKSDRPTVPGNNGEGLRCLKRTTSHTRVPESRRAETTEPRKVTKVSFELPEESAMEK